MKRPTEQISKLKHCFNGEFQDVCDYIVFLENLTKTQRRKTIDEIAFKLCTEIYFGYEVEARVVEILEQMKGDKE